MNVSSVRDLMSDDDSGIVNIRLDFGNSSGGIEDYVPNYSDFKYVHNHWDNIVLLALYIPTFIAAVVMNSLVIITVLRYKHLRSVTNYFLVNLSFADLFVTLICMPMAIGTSIVRPWIYGSFMCKFTAYLQGISVSASVFSILVMSMDRFWAIRQPMRFRQVFNKRLARKVILVIWFVACGAFIPLLIVRRLEGFHFTNTEHSILFCVERWPGDWNRQAYGICLFFIVYAVPSLLVLVSYISTGYRLVESGSVKEGTNLGLERDSRLLQTRRRAARTLLILAAVFALCWLPYNVINLILDSTSIGREAADLLMKTLPFTLWLGHANSAANPLLYSFLSVHFRSSLVRIIKRSTSGAEQKVWRVPKKPKRRSSVDPHSSFELQARSPRAGGKFGVLCEKGKRAPVPVTGMHSVKTVATVEIALCEDEL